MSHMNTNQVLDLLVSLDHPWPAIGSYAVVEGMELRSTGWRWSNNVNGKVVLESPTGVWIHEYMMEDCMLGKQGDPNAHESVRCKVTASGDASGADVKRAVEDAVKASTKPAEWDGEGLPPAGEVVEVRDEDMDAFRVIVIGYSFDETQAAVEYIADRALEFVDVDDLRPIRSERDQMTDDVLALLDCTGINTLTLADMASALYDAGYRKTEGA